MVRAYKRRYGGSGSGRARSRAAAYRAAKRRSMVARGRYRVNRRPYRLPRAVAPKKRLVRLKYCELISLNPGVATLAYHNFSCNGMYDPNVTSTGHQPIGFDQHMAWFDHYTVIASKITIMGQAEDTTSEMLVGIFKNDDTTFLPTTAQHACELPDSKYKLVAEKDNGEGTTWRLTSKFNAKKDLSISKPLSEKDLAGTSGANPDEQTFWTIWAGPVGSADLASVNVWVHIEYIAVLTEPKDMIQS